MMTIKLQLDLHKSWTQLLNGILLAGYVFILMEIWQLLIPSIKKWWSVEDSAWVVYALIVLGRLAYGRIRKQLTLGDVLGRLSGFIFLSIVL